VSDRAPQGKDTDNIWVMDSQGGNPVQLTNTPGWENERPAWSSDGAQIAYYHFGLEGLVDPSYGPSGIYIVSAAGGEERLLLEDESLFMAHGDAPLWSPDRQYLACSLGFEDTVLNIISTSDGALVWSSNLPGRNNELSWSSNSA
jgi:Tol biopolymer transport system component